jgi:uncharacterized protein YdeI (YjbR/CyaY-like superfamily)
MVGSDLRGQTRADPTRASAARSRCGASWRRRWPPASSAGSDSSDALDYLSLLATEAPDRYDRAARRWLARLLADAAAWRVWLERHHGQRSGVWLVLAKEGTTEPTTLRQEEALLEALCFGWIDGQLRRRDDGSYRQRFTPRRLRSVWSKRNVEIAERLLAEGRMRPAGLAAIERARGDGSWLDAYAGPATIEVPDDLAAALAEHPQAAAMFERLTSQNRYAILYRLATAKRAETRNRRLEQYVAMLARGETIHPQRQMPIQR